jgi:hypothetical protein
LPKIFPKNERTGPLDSVSLLEPELLDGADLFVEVLELEVCLEDAPLEEKFLPLGEFLRSCSNS